MATYQITQIRYDEDGSQLWDAWCVLYATAEKAITDFNPSRMFEYTGPDASYSVVELDNSYVATGKEWAL